jgi:hypothetical protein
MANAQSSIYGGLASGGVNQFGFKPQSVQDSNQMANFLQSSENSSMTGGAQNLAGGAGILQSGQSTTGQGIQALSPVLQYLTQLTKGDQGDIAQATQGQTNQIKDSFAAIRNMISAQPRGGGKAGVLAEAPYQQEKQIGDLQQGARAGAANQLGNVANSLAGLGLQQQNVGLGEQGLGLSQQSLALQTALSQRGQNVEERAATEQMIGNLVKGASDVASAALPKSKTN